MPVCSTIKKEFFAGELVIAGGIILTINKRIVAFLCSLLMLASIIPWSAINAAASFDGVLQFNGEGKFTVMQLADIQENKDVDPGTIDLITKAIARYSPDLIILTGDNIKGLISANSFRAAVDQFLAPILASGTKFAVTFGNHDDLGAWPVNPGTREEQYAYYKQKGGSLFVDHDIPALDGTGSGSIPVFPFGKTSGLPAFQLFLMDSGGYMNVTLDLDGVRTSQIDYYLTTNPTVPSIWFQHIPVPEFYNLLLQVPSGTPDSYEGSHEPFNDFTWAMNSSLIDWKASGSGNVADIYKEAPGPTNLETYQGDQYRSSAGYGSKTLYEAWLANGNMKGAFFGHNHTNSFVGTTPDGVTLGFAKAATLQGYNDGDPGVRIFEIDDSGSYTTIGITRSMLNSFGVGDYSAVNSAISAARVMKNGTPFFRANSFNDPRYYNPSSTTIGNGVFSPAFFTDGAAELQTAIDAVEHNLDSRFQSAINGFAATISSAWQALCLKPADYSAVENLLAAETQTEMLAPPYYQATHLGQRLPLEYYISGTLEHWNTAKITVTRNLKVPDQDVVNGMLNSLRIAYEALRLKPEYERGNLAPASGASTIVNHGSLFIYGLFPGITQSEFESEFVILYGSGQLEYVQNAAGFGTGTRINYIDTATGTIIYTYILLVFGDVNGDGNVDSGDAGTAVDVENYMVSWDSTEDAAFISAGDVNGDGATDSIDAGMMVDFENYMTEIVQTRI